MCADGHMAEKGRDSRVGLVGSGAGEHESARTQLHEQQRARTCGQRTRRCLDDYVYCDASDDQAIT
eukprot:13737302-Alexandrium_andersonii.AAC.1